MCFSTDQRACDQVFFDVRDKCANTFSKKWLENCNNCQNSQISELTVGMFNSHRYIVCVLNSFFNFQASTTI